MKRTGVAMMVVGLTMVLTACGFSRAALAPGASVAAPGLTEPAAPAQAAALETAVDEQGAVSMAVTPLDLSQAATSLDFEVAMDTHSVDLSMDLAALATLTTDDGRSISATRWDGEPGGHHVSGVLSFPATLDGAVVLAGVSRLTLTIRDVDAPVRTFVWTLAN